MSASDLDTCADDGPPPAAASTSTCSSTSSAAHLAGRRTTRAFSAIRAGCSPRWPAAASFGDTRRFHRCARPTALRRLCAADAAVAGGLIPSTCASGAPGELDFPHRAHAAATLDTLRARRCGSQNGSSHVGACGGRRSPCCCWPVRCRPLRGRSERVVVNLASEVVHPVRRAARQRSSSRYGASPGVPAFLD